MPGARCNLLRACRDTLVPFHSLVQSMRTERSMRLHVSVQRHAAAPCCPGSAHLLDQPGLAAGQVCAPLKQASLHVLFVWLVLV